MHGNQKPLFSLTIGEFIALNKTLINAVLNDKEEQKENVTENEKSNEEHFSIKELANFLRCSKVSIHNYKKQGMPFYRIGRKILFKKLEVLNFMKSLKSKRVITV
jgi:excisionase family DNA binding protein